MKLLERALVMSAVLCCAALSAPPGVSAQQDEGDKLFNQVALEVAFHAVPQYPPYVDDRHSLEVCHRDTENSQENRQCHARVNAQAQNHRCHINS